MDKWTIEDKRKDNLDNVAKGILYKILDKNTFNKIKLYKSAKEIWEKLIQLCEGNEQMKGKKTIGCHSEIRQHQNEA